MDSEEKLMRLAIGLAEGGRGLANPNPMVGAAVVNSGEIVGFGYHERYGGDHAETVALKRAGEKAEGSTLYVSLEPCCHTGQTPPCTGTIIDSGITRVVVGEIDPNPAANGKGVRILEESGIDVVLGVLSEEVRKLNRSYFKWRETGRPWVRLKLAMTLDGKVADSSGQSKWISGETSRRIVHGWRGETDAVMVGIKTALTDNPSLLPRGGHKKLPARLVVDSKLKLPVESKLIDETGVSPVIVATMEAGSTEKADQLKAHGVTVWTLPEENGHVSLETLFDKLAEDGIIDLMCEGGPELAGALLDKKLIDAMSLFIAPKLMGASGVSAFGGMSGLTIDSMVQFPELTGHRSGEDVLLEIPVSNYN